MPSYDVLYNLTGRNISDYLMKTREDFFKRRYGGFEFGVRNPLANRNLTQAEAVAQRWLKVRVGQHLMDHLVSLLINGTSFSLSLDCCLRCRRWMR